MLQQEVVYLEWPADVIAAAVTEFNEQMHSGAGAEEIQAGLHGLDFLTRRSGVGADLQARIDGCVVEARMRVELLAQQEAEQKSAAETLASACKAGYQLYVGLRAIQRRIEQASLAWTERFIDDLEDEEDE